MPVERYAVTFLELQQAPVTQDELQKAEVQMVVWLKLKYKIASFAIKFLFRICAINHLTKSHFASALN